MEQTIAAISTAIAPGGIGIVRISGAGAKETADRVFRSASGRKISQSEGYTALYGHIAGPNGIVDEAIALLFTAPKSYTGEDVVELSCHGGPAVLREVLRLTLAAGAILAQPGEFTKRAFMNGKMSLTQAEAVMDIIGAKGQQAARAAVAVKEGSLFRKLEEIKEDLTNAAAWLAAWADFPEEDIPEVNADALLPRLHNALAAIQKLIASFDTGRLLREGIDTVIAGCPNVGKSTFMNYLCGHESSIVTPIPGTTRDIVSEEILLGDYLLHLSDTAGLRTTDDTVEKFGVERARQRLETAQLILAVFDASRPLQPEDMELLTLCRNRKAIAIVNKTDLPRQTDIAAIAAAIPYLVQLSALEQTGGDDLVRQLDNLFSLCDMDAADGMLCNERQLHCAGTVAQRLTECIDLLQAGMTLDAVSVCLESALEALMELSGERVTDQVADQVFHQFCVGK